MQIFRRSNITRLGAILPFYFCSVDSGLSAFEDGRGLSPSIRYLISSAKLRPTPPAKSGHPSPKDSSPNADIFLANKPAEADSFNRVCKGVSGWLTKACQCMKWDYDDTDPVFPLSPIWRYRHLIDWATHI